ncbi:BTAD domain-containing putative transcriptional regulator [Actinoplanes sp. NPDC051494]|uniref:AfsR/SARP family transcriptional regulator n=1 Tax=Actinoplanes sp. NPDC051494 TaxID=3363907 RepID=UPI0037B3DE52
MTVHLRILGPLRVIRGDGEVDAGPNQQRCLLALLLAREGHPISMNELIELLWGPSSPPTAVNVIHKYIGVLRRLLEPGLPPRAPGEYLLRHGNGYRFTAGPESLDLVRFRHLVAQASAHAGRDEFDEALDRYTEALRLGAGRVADGLADTPSARAVFAGLDSEFSDALLAAAEIAVRLRRPGLLLAPLRRAAELDPLNELLQASLMTTLAAAGHQAEALAAYRTVRGSLAAELGIDPGHALQEAHRRVLTQTVVPAGGTDSPGPLIHPAQLPPDLPMFTGREHELAALDTLAAGLRAEGRTGPLVITMDGPDGAGKSTLAVRFAHLVADRFPDGQLYLDLRESRPDNLLRSLLYGLGLRRNDVPDTFDALVGTYRSLTAGRRLLILLDHAHDAEQVRPLLPSSAGTLVLVTSGPPLLDLAARAGAHQLRVDPPDPPAARELFARRLDGRDRPDSAALAEIVELCGRMPLTLSLLAARLAAAPTLSLTAVSNQLRQDPDRRAVR